jgi:hypothetical protein
VYIQIQHCFANAAKNNTKYERKEKNKKISQNEKKKSQVVQIYVDFVNIMNEYFSAIKVRMRRIVCLFGVKSKFIYCTLNSFSRVEFFLTFPCYSHLISMWNLVTKFKMNTIKYKYISEGKIKWCYTQKPQNRVYNF